MEVEEGGGRGGWRDGRMVGGEDGRRGGWRGVNGVEDEGGREEEICTKRQNETERNKET